MLVKELWRCEFQNAYRNRNEVERVTVILYFNPNAGRESIINKVTDIIEKQVI